MVRGLVYIVLFATVAFASGSHDTSGQTDIVQRTINFIIFVALIWYLISNPIKNYFKGRSDSIKDELESVQRKLNESVKRKKEALSKISDAEKLAEEILENTKKENKILNDKILASCDAEIENMEKIHQSQMELAQRRMVKSVVEEVISTVIEESSNEFNKDAMVNVILKKVA